MSSQKQMGDWFRVALRAYQTRSAEKFQQSRQAETKASGPKTTRNQLDARVKAFERVIFPALEEYLAKAARTYNEWKLRKPGFDKKKTPQKLGSGEPVEALFAAVRREKWLLSLARRAHVARAPLPTPMVQIVVCGIPEDVRCTAHQRYMRRRLSFSRCFTKQSDKSSSPVLGTLQQNEELTLCLSLITRNNDYHIHVSRCKTLSSKGKRDLVRVGIVLQRTSEDIFEAVRKRYHGKPDELYRRKTARKFARWRRLQREQQKEKQATEVRAEKEMKRRRGLDHRLTAREARDATFAPFLFDTNCTAYAYSSKITEAPKLRKVMMTKYSDIGKSAEDEPDQWERAREAAKENPLFHTRVMNRFS